MCAYALDATDHQLLELLQTNARTGAVDLAEELGVSDNTVHNRIASLQEAGVINGFTVIINHDLTKWNLRYLFICTARISNRRSVAKNALALPGVTDVTELMTGQRNLHVKAVGADKQDMTDLATELDNFNLEINDEILIRDEHTASPNYDELEGQAAE